MHLSYFFIHRLASALDSKLRNNTLVGAFSQNKDELILDFHSRQGINNLKIRCLLSTSFTSLSFPEMYSRARINSIDLFKPILGKKVVGLRQFENERAFLLQFEDEYNLLFKLFGNRSNIVLFHKGIFLEMFHDRMVQDQKPDLSLDRDLHVSKEHFLEDPQISKWFPFLKGLPEKYLNSRDYDELRPEKKWEVIHETLEILINTRKYYLIRLDQQLHLSLLKLGNVISSYDDPLTAATDFHKRFLNEFILEKEKRSFLATLTSQKSKNEGYLRKTTEKLNSLQNETNYQQTGDILMANIHSISPGMTSVSLENFYTGKEITIKLKTSLSPQKNAENYYRKAKNQVQEIRILEANLKQKKSSIDKIQKNIHQIENISTIKELRSFSKSLGISGPSAKEKTVLPYKELTVMGFTLLIGKNARSNDRLLNTYTRKEDLWLHVKDAPGSHVIIKHQSGKVFTPLLIERAAQIAAFHSKRRTESVVPVSYTPRKFVRKRKGDPPGMVAVDREKVILVEPLK